MKLLIRPHVPYSIVSKDLVIINRKANPNGMFIIPKINKINPEYAFYHNIPKWLKNKNMDLKYFQEPNIKLKFSFSEEQYNLVQDGLDLCGDTMIGKSRIFRWVPPNSIWRTPFSK